MANENTDEMWDRRRKLMETPEPGAETGSTFCRNPLAEPEGTRVRLPPAPP